MQKFFAFLLMLSLLALACKSQQSGTMDGPQAGNLVDFPSDAAPVAFETVKQARYCGVQDKRSLLLRSEEAWTSLWQEVGSNQMPAPALPEVDFGSQVLIACFMGAQNTGGYGLEIQRIQVKGKTAFVSVKHSKPGPNCFVTEAITQPYQIVSLPKGQLSEAVFAVEEVVQACGE